MKNITQLFKFKAIALFAALFFVSALAEATHFRYGTMNWEIKSTGPLGTVVEFNITQSWRTTFPPYGGVVIGSIENVGTFNFGDATSAPLLLVTTAVNLGEDWFVGSATLTHTYSAAITTNVVAFFSGNARISTLEQNNNDRPYRTETTVTLSNLSNNSPVASTPPIFYVSENQITSIQINAFDPDGDPLTFAYSTSAQSGLITVIPSIATGLSSSGLLSLNTNSPAVDDQFASQVMVSDNKGAKVPLDFIIQIVAFSNPPAFIPPTPANATVINVGQGNLATFTVQASDVDPGSIVDIFGTGIPVGATFVGTPGNPASSTFSWTPTGADLGAYVIAFTAQDNLFSQANTSVTVNVVPCSISATAVPTDVSCAGSSDGAIDLTLGGNYGAVTIAWTGPGSFTANTEDISGLATGSYTVTATGNFGLGCSVTKTYIVGTTPDITPPTATGYNTTFTAQYFTGTNFNVLAVTDEVPTINNHWYYGSPYPAQIGNDYFSIRYTGKTVAPATGNYTFRTLSDDGIRLWVNGQLIINNWTLHPGTYNTGSITLTGNQEVDIKIEFFESGGYAIARLEWLAPFAGINSYQAVPARSNSCKNLTIQLDASGLASITTGDVDPGFTDVCGIESITLSKSNFDCSNIGSNTVILTATDKHGNVSTCNAIVTVKDEIDPVAIAQNVVVQLDATGNGSTTAVLVDNGSNDACGILSMELSKTDFTCADIATNPSIVTLTVTDIHGNVSTATAEVTVKDDVQANVVTKNITVQLDATGNVSITVDQVDDGSSDACGIASMSVAPSTFTCSNVGNNTVTLTVTDVNGNVSSQTAVVKVEDNILPTWVTNAGSLNRSVSCGNAGTLAAAMALAPTATDNCSVTITKTTGAQIGNTITNTWSATDASGNASLVLFTQVITITAVTIDASGSSTPVALGSTATLHAKVTPAEAGISVTFLLDQGTVAYGTYGTYTATTDALGIATQTVTGLLVEVYRVYAIAGDGCANSTAYLAVYDPTGGFVTGGGWITSPLGAYVANPALTGKANFGFVSKYKKGSNVPDGNTEFQFHAGNLNFSSSSYSAGSLVIAGKQAIYKGVGTINGVSGYSFMVSAVDGQVSGGGGIDMFRMKIWNTSTGAIVYDNNVSSADNATPTTALGGGSVVIHTPTTKSAEIATAIEPVVEFSELKAYPNPFSDKLFFEFSRKADAKASLTLFDAAGRKLSVLFDQQIQANENYRVEYVPKDLSTNMLFYRMIFDDEVINGKMIYKK